MILQTLSFASQTNCHHVGDVRVNIIQVNWNTDYRLSLSTSLDIHDFG